MKIDQQLLSKFGTYTMGTRSFDSCSVFCAGPIGFFVYFCHGERRSISSFGCRLVDEIIEALQVACKANHYQPSQVC